MDYYQRNYEKAQEEAKQYALNKISHPITEKQFYDKFCSVCGSQQCSGYQDEEFREGCKHYNQYLKTV